MHTMQELDGMGIHAADGDLGHIADLYFDDKDWRVRFLVVDTGRWLPGRKVLISPEAITGIDWDRRHVNVNLTRDQVRNSPDVDTERPVSRSAALDVSRHYGWMESWILPVGGIGAAPGTNVLLGDKEDRDRAAEAGELGGDPHLRSYDEVRGYEVSDGVKRLGSLDNITLSDDMRMTELIIDTGRVLPGEEMRISVADVRDIQWAHSKIVVA